MACIYSLLFWLYYLILFVSDKVVSKTIESIGEGELAPEGTYTYTVLVDTGKSVCTGVIIDKSHILTAGHCVTDNEGNFRKMLTITAGTNDVFANDDAINIPVKDICVLSEFILEMAILYASDDSDSELDELELFYYHDIAILRLQDDLNIEDNPTIFSAVQLPKEQPEGGYEGKTATFSGFGRFADDEDLDGKLRSLNLSIASTKDCKNHVREISIKNYKDFLCARGFKAKSRTCKGDSGGPLVYDRTLVGILSGGDTCNLELSYFNNVWNYMDFINNVRNHADEDNIFCEKLKPILKKN